MTFTYQDFETKAKEAGLLEQFSDADLKLAQNNPDAGMSLLQTKIDYGNATNAEDRAAAHTVAENIRKQFGGYTGGTDGSSFYASAIPTPSSFNAGDKPTYSYNALEDPTYQTYKDVYTREGERAAEDTLGRAAQQTGGMASSYAATAAAAQQQEYAKKIADIIPELEAQAYNRYQNELSQYNADRSFNYGQLLDQISFAQNERTQAQNLVNIKLELGQEVSDAELAAAGYDRAYADGYAAEKAKTDAKTQVDMWISNSIIPGDELLAKAGYDAEAIERLKASQEASGAVTEETLYEKLRNLGATADDVRGYIAALGYSEYAIENIAEGYISWLAKAEAQPQEELQTYTQMLNVAKNYSADKLQEEITFAKENGYAQWYISELEKLLAAASESEAAVLNGGSV